MTRPKLTHVDRDRLRHMADRAAHFRRVDHRGKRTAVPAPAHVIADMMAQRPFPVPEIVGVVLAPFFTPSGRLVLVPGYDAETKRNLHLPDSLLDLNVPENPTVEDVERSVAVILDLLCDFPFVTEADLANAIAKLLDPFTRTIHDSITPLYVLVAPAQGTGKGLLADVLTIPATGEKVMRASFVKGEAELDKRLLALLLDGTDHVHFDNLEGTLNSAVFASFLTSEVYSGRVLGQSTMPSLPQRVNTSLSGNNVMFGGDIGRRVALVKLDAGLEHPKERTGFAHEHLDKWAVDNRALIVQACLTVVQSWVRAGMQPGSVTLGSFEKWARTTSGILEHAGIRGLLANHEEVDGAADVERDAWVQWVSAWWEMFGDRLVKPAELVELVDLVDNPPFWVADNGGERSLSSSIGKALMKKRDTIFGRFRIRLARTDTVSGSKFWKLERTVEEGPATK